MEAKSITLIGQALSGGGAELSMLRLAENFQARGFDVRVAVLKKRGRLVELLPPQLSIDEIGGGRLSCIPRLASYLRRHRSDAIISFMTYPNVVAVAAQALSLSAKRVVVSEHNTYSKSIRRRGILRLIYQAAPYVYRWSRKVICVSRGVEDDLVETTTLPRRYVTTVYNPVITEALLVSSTATPQHEWLTSRIDPVLLAVGRLEPQKNYPMLLRALAIVRKKRPCRLIILGEGPLRGELERDIEKLGLKDCVDLHGFAPDAMSYMRAADLFVLASSWEGLSNVLIEAMAVGCPVVSTDAPHGPREVLRGGEFGRLVPVDDAEALAAAIEATLDDPGDATARTEWARSFSVDACAERYLAIAGLPPTCATSLRRN
jgi:glycosyltransferase involved in cell wall biosynthesis